MIITVRVVSKGFIRAGRGAGGTGAENSSRRVHRGCARKQIKNERRALINSRLRREVELTRPNEKMNKIIFARDPDPRPPRAALGNCFSFSGRAVRTHGRGPVGRRRGRERVSSDTHNIIIYVSSYIAL